MSIEIVTEDSTTYQKDELEKNAKKLIIDALEEYDAEPWDMGLIVNIIKTLKHQQQCFNKIIKSTCNTKRNTL